MPLNEMDTVDRAAILAGTGLMLFGTVVLGLIEILAGEPYSPAVITNEAGDVIATPLIDPNIRTGLVVLGVLILALWSVYKLLAVDIETEETQTTEQAAD